jgi:hypothetical protein
VWLGTQLYRVVSMQSVGQSFFGSNDAEVAGVHPSLGVFQQPFVFPMVKAESLFVCSYKIPLIVGWKINIVCLSYTRGTFTCNCSRWWCVHLRIVFGCMVGLRRNVFRFRRWKKSLQVRVVEARRIFLPCERLVTSDGVKVSR